MHVGRNIQQSQWQPDETRACARTVSRERERQRAQRRISKQNRPSVGTIVRPLEHQKDNGPSAARGPRTMFQHVRARSLRSLRWSPSLYLNKILLGQTGRPENLPPGSCDSLRFSREWCNVWSGDGISHKSPQSPINLPWNLPSLFTSGGVKRAKL